MKVMLRSIWPSLNNIRRFLNMEPKGALPRADGRAYSKHNACVIRHQYQGFYVFLPFLAYFPSGHLVSHPYNVCRSCSQRPVRIVIDAYLVGTFSPSRP
jgi:hypothetical protein